MVILHLDKPRELKFSHKAIQKFSALTRTPLTELKEAVTRYDLMSAAVYCMLSAADEALTPEQVDDMLERLPPLKVYTAAVEAVTEALNDGETPGEDEDGDGVENPPGAAGAGGRA